MNKIYRNAGIPVTETLLTGPAGLEKFDYFWSLKVGECISALWAGTLRAYCCVYLCNGRAFRVPIFSLCTALQGGSETSQKRHGFYCQTPAEQKTFKSVWVEHFGRMPFHPVPRLPVIPLFPEHHHDASFNLSSFQWHSAARHLVISSWAELELYSIRENTTVYSEGAGQGITVRHKKSRLNWSVLILRKMHSVIKCRCSEHQIR